MRLSKELARLAAAASAITLLSVASAVWAESSVPDPGNFFGTTPEFDPNAAGTKYDGTMSIAFVFTFDPVGCSASGDRRISNMFVVMSLKQGNGITAFNTDFRANPDPNPLIGKPETPSFCFIEMDKQIRFVTEMIRTRIVPALYAPCVPRPLDPNQVIPSACPEYKIKSMSNMLSSGHGSFRADITIAVRD